MWKSQKADDQNSAAICMSGVHFIRSSASRDHTVQPVQCIVQTELFMALDYGGTSGL
jgi:hypothetical protein